MSMHVLVHQQSIQPTELRAIPLQRAHTWEWLGLPKMPKDLLTDLSVYEGLESGSGIATAFAFCRRLGDFLRVYLMLVSMLGTRNDFVSPLACPIANSTATKSCRP